MRIISTERSQVLAARIAAKLGVPLVETKFTRFPDGEMYLRCGELDDETLIVSSPASLASSAVPSALKNPSVPLRPASLHPTPMLLSLRSFQPFGSWFFAFRFWGLYSPQWLTMTRCFLQNFRTLPVLARMKKNEPANPLGWKMAAKHPKSALRWPRGARLR